MGDFWSGQVGNQYCPQIKLSANVTAYDATSDTITWTLDYVAHGYGFYISGNRQWNVNIDGQVWSGTANVYGSTGTVRLGSGTKVVAKTYSDKNVGCSASMSFNGYWNGAYINWAECSGTVFTGKKTSYTVSYNANGGSGAPGSQTKWHGENITLSATKPSRAGYSFSKWNTNASGTGTSYNPGSTYSANANATLYAIWSANTYTVSYNANGGTGAPGAQTKVYGKTLTLSSTRPTRTNYNFLGWGTSAGSTTVAYNPGGSYTTNAGITLYAIWQLAYVLPRISNLTADRCLTDGTISDEGTSVKVSFSWSTDRSVTAIVIRWRLQSNAIWLSSKTISASGTSGTVSTIINAVFDTEQPYVIEVGVRDSGGVINAQTTVSTTEYMIDLLKGGKGVAIGAAANKDGLTVGWPSRFTKLIDAGGGIDVYSQCNVNAILKANQRIDASAGMNSRYNIDLLGIGTGMTKGYYGSSWINSREIAMVRNYAISANSNQYSPVISLKTKNGEWSIGTLTNDDYLRFCYTSDADYGNGESINQINRNVSFILRPRDAQPEIGEYILTGTYNGFTVKLYLVQNALVVAATVEWAGTVPSSELNKDLIFPSLQVPVGMRPRNNVYFSAEHLTQGTLYNPTQCTRYYIGTDGRFHVTTNAPQQLERHASISWISDPDH